MPYTNVCNLLKPLKLNFNTPKPVIKADPNTPLKISLHYHYQMQAITDDQNNSNISHIILTAQNHHYNIHNNSRTQIHD